MDPITDFLNSINAKIICPVGQGGFKSVFQIEISGKNGGSKSHQVI